jgi:hypothetical protein
MLSCDFRLADPADVHGVQASVDVLRLATGPWGGYPTPRSLTAVLLLVDSSASGGASGAPSSPPEDVARVMDTAPRHVHFGLAVFDSDLLTLVPITDNRGAVREALRQIKPTDRSTELYRSALDAVRVLARTPADRRALFIFSDGSAEDRAYFHQDVVNAAEAAGVTIVGFGYAKAPERAVALQTLRRLSEETGGVFVAADGGASALAGRALEAAYALLDSGGSARFDLLPLLRDGHQGTARVRLTVQTSRASHSVVVPVELPSLASVSPAEPPATGTARADPTPPAPAASIRPHPSPAPSASGPDWPWLPLLGAFGGVVLLGAAGWLRAGRKRRRPAGPAAGAGEPFGYLELQDEPQGQRFALTGPTVRIGRRRDNEVVLDDSSVSRHHAEIHRGRDGSVTLVDLDSLNGVFVNQRQIKRAVLSEGDAVEIGDVRLLFTNLPGGSVAPAEEAGVLERTLLARKDEPVVRLSVRD